jgi:hypothetical protein
VADPAKREKKKQHNNDDQQQSTLRHGRRRRKKILRVNAAAAVIRLPDIYSARPRTHTNDKLLSLPPAHTCAQFLSIEYLERHLR